ncbi:hypothetical protein BDK51DRAFT_1455, partial [Blyttiomyces helicus]
GLRDIIKEEVKFSRIDFTKSSKTPLGFALGRFPVDDPAKENLHSKQAELDVYRAAEFFVRKNGGHVALLKEIKVPKFFLQFQIARIEAAQRLPSTFKGGVKHQGQKVLKNAQG